MLRFRKLLTGVTVAAGILAIHFVSVATGAIAAELISGEIKKVDSDAGKITIQHGPWKKFDMDHGMTMVFKAADPAMLKAVKAGDKVKFDAEKVQGQFTVTKIEKAK